MQGKEKAGLRAINESMALDDRATKKASSQVAAFAQQVNATSGAIKDAQMGSYYQKLGDVYANYGKGSSGGINTAGLKQIDERAKEIMIEKGIKAEDKNYNKLLQDARIQATNELRAIYDSFRMPLGGPISGSSLTTSTPQVFNVGNMFSPNLFPNN